MNHADHRAAALSYRIALTRSKPHLAECLSEFLLKP
jgi:hypothetical protein